MNKFRAVLKQLPKKQRKLLQSSIRLSVTLLRHLSTSHKMKFEGEVELSPAVKWSDGLIWEPITAEVYSYHQNNSDEVDQSDACYLLVDHNWRLFECSPHDCKKMIKALRAWAKIEYMEPPIKPDSAILANCKHLITQ